MFHCDKLQIHSHFRCQFDKAQLFFEISFFCAAESARVSTEVFLDRYIILSQEEAVQGLLQ